MGTLHYYQIANRTKKGYPIHSERNPKRLCKIASCTSILARVIVKYDRFNTQTLLADIECNTVLFWGVIVDKKVGR